MDDAESVKDTDKTQQAPGLQTLLLLCLCIFYVNDCVSAVITAVGCFFASLFACVLLQTWLYRQNFNVPRGASRRASEILLPYCTFLSIYLPVQVFVAAQVFQLHSLDLVVVQMKLMETVWEI